MPQTDDLYRLAHRVEHSAVGVRGLAAQVVAVGELTWRGPAAQAFRGAVALRHRELLRLAERVETVAADVRTVAAVVTGLETADPVLAPGRGPGPGPGPGRDSGSGSGSGSGGGTWA